MIKNSTFNYPAFTKNSPSNLNKLIESSTKERVYKSKIDDLKEEVNSLNEEIAFLKQSSKVCVY